MRRSHVEKYLILKLATRLSKAITYSSYVHVIVQVKTNLLVPQYSQTNIMIDRSMNYFSGFPSLTCPLYG